MPEFLADLTPEAVHAIKIGFALVFVVALVWIATYRDH
jgi:hypothetical protein